MQPALSVVIATHDNLPLLQRCVQGWRRHAAGQPVELVVVEDGCRDGTTEWLRQEAESEWGARHLRWLHADNVHELVCTNLGLQAARGELVLSWHDDMFLQAAWLVPELLATFRAYPRLGLLALSRGLNFSPRPAPESWLDTVDWGWLQSTIGPPPLNWLRLQEVDAVMRPWVVRRSCIVELGGLDEAFRPTEWDEADLCFRLRGAGWLVATHGYERDGAYLHAGSSTYARSPAPARQAAVLRNARIFAQRWAGEIEARHARRRGHWRRRATPAGWAATLAQMARFAVGRKGAA